MFQTAVKHVAKSSGCSTLHPVSDLNSASHFKTLCLVKRKTSFWFWKKPKMTATQVELKDLFEAELTLPKAKESVILEDYQETPTFKIDGNIGSKLASELNLNVSGSDTMSLTIKLGDIVKSEVDWELVQEELETQRIKLHHPLLREVKKSKRTTLCVVLESLATKNDGEFEKQTDVIVKTDDSGDLLKKSILTVNINTKDDVESKKTSSFKIPPGTVLAYSCNEFSINSVGQATLHSAIDRRDTLDEPLFLKNTEDSDPIEVVRVEFQPLIKSSKFDQIKNEFKHLIGNADNDVLGSMHLLLAAAEFKIENKTEERTLSISTVEKLFQQGEDPMFNSILLHLGFELPGDWHDENAVIKFPDAQYDLIKAVISFIDALIDVDVSVRKLLADTSQPNIQVLLNIVSNEVQGKENKLSDKGIDNLFQSSPTSRLILKNAGFIEMKMDDEDNICFARSKHFQIMDLYTILYIFSQ